MNLTVISDKMKPVSTIIAIDGYSSSGKSTFARAIAASLGYIYIDSGAMYRAVALYCLENAISEEELPARLDEINIRFSVEKGNGKQHTILNNRNVEELIRGVEVSGIVSRISRIKAVRAKLVRMQREFGIKGGVVMDGRDIGTVVFPEAGMKIFMNASPEVRARRRYDVLLSKGIKVSYDEILSNIVMRDNEDAMREESPLRKADDALLLDNNNMTMDDQMKWFKEQWQKLHGNAD
jgi:cytidylate kinase